VDWLLLPPAALIGVEIGASFGAWRVLAADRGGPVRVGTREISRVVREGCVRSLFRVIPPPGWGWGGPGPHPGQLVSLAGRWALLLPLWVWAISSPASSIGTPWESRSVERKLRTCLSRRAFTAGSSVSPSTPQFHERLSVVPSRFASRFASLCRSS